MSPQKHLFSLCLFSLLAVSACKPEAIPVVGAPVDSMLGKRASTETRLSTEASVAIAQGKTGEALAKFENLYKLNPRDLTTAVNYAQLLRKSGKSDRALAVLAPFFSSAEGKPLATAPSPLLLNEYAASSLALGNYDVAEKHLNTVLEDAQAESYHHDAQNLMGIVLDTKGQHKEAEHLFREALVGWKGDATSVMNNLALCLAQQGKFDEALSTLRQALVLSPNKQEIARNITLVNDLREAVLPKPAPKMAKK